MSTPTPIEYKIIDVICDLIKAQMQLSSEQVWIYNQKQTIPDTPGLFVEVAFVHARVFATNSVTGEDDAGNFCEFQSVNMQETYTVVLYSRDESAFTRAPEVVMALSGVLAQQAQELYGFRLGPLPTSFLDTSAVEAAARLFRQDITFNALRHHTSKRIIQYFDKFNIPPFVTTNQ